MPEQVGGAQRLFELMIGGTPRYCTPTEPLNFISGYKYTVELDVTDAGITLQTQINPWEDGGSIGGPAGPQ